MVLGRHYKLSTLNIYYYCYSRQIFSISYRERESKNNNSALENPFIAKEVSSDLVLREQQQHLGAFRNSEPHIYYITICTLISLPPPPHHMTCEHRQV